jgi:hypothetical protein
MNTLTCLFTCFIALATWIPGLRHSMKTYPNIKIFAVMAALAICLCFFCRAMKGETA